MDVIIPQPDSMVDMDDWYNYPLSTADMTESFVGCSSNPLASYGQSITANFTPSPQYLNSQGTQYPWNTIDTSMFYQKTPPESMTTAGTSFAQYVPDPTPCYSSNGFFGGYTGEDEAGNSDSSYDYRVPDLEPSLSDSATCSETEDCAMTSTTTQQRSQNPKTRRGRSREKRATQSRKATAREQKHASSRVSRLQRTSSSDGEDLAHTLAKQTHSAIERKYRNNLNAKMWQLHRTLEGTSWMSSTSTTTTSSDDNSDAPPQRQGEQQPPRKSDILSNALQYIDESELEMRHMSDEIQRLTSRLAALQRLVRCGGDCDALKQIVQMKMAS
ncbi:hypothetical protein AYL99_10426 [Fonsecaea erecta]|uniref:BHLH domain-containing protein n=1 Tax=Fonsecaea erecta TaxID=1367422 RepID=A0A178Z8F1_9EURO|nr:hypothetical protein AYL99_10426 [Fonsecaea erecta]OAP55453.1 hypothetical protein AYL99_10426 [Fonsecaea erecta]